jgi:hypothetical protein
MKGVIDMHVHSNPDVRLRAYDDIELMEAAISVGARAIVIKTHEGNTTDRAFLCNRHNEIVHGKSNDFQMFGGVTLNRQIGGINPYAVESALKLGAKTIWLPSQSARNHIEKQKGDLNKAVDVIKDGRIVPELKDIFKMIADYDVVLGTAHVSPYECFKIVEEARKSGIKKIVVTHPEWWIVDMSIEDQLKIVKDYDVILERCFAQNMGGGKYKSNLEENVEVIKTCGYKNVMVSTDGGQVENANWEIAYQNYMSYLLENGIPENHVYYMTRTIQKNLLNIED